MQKKVKSLSDNHKESEAKFVILKPAGYPMKTGFDYPEISEPKVFHHYAKEQWFGSSVKKVISFLTEGCILISLLK